MKKGSVKFIIIFIIILSAGAAAFIIGWTQFAIPPGKYGVMVSKSGGYHSKAITSGSFLWRWERLIPTNSEILIFDLSPYTAEHSLTGNLLNAEKYGKISAEKKDFAWGLEIKTSLKIKTNFLVQIVKNNELKNQDELIKYTSESAEKNIKASLDSCILYYLKNPEKYTEEEFRQKFKKELANLMPEFETEMFSFEFSDPDFAEYYEAKKIYEEYKNTEEKILAFKVEKLKKLQSALAELTGDISSSLKALDEIIRE